MMIPFTIISIAAYILSRTYSTSPLLKSYSFKRPILLKFIKRF